MNGIQYRKARTHTKTDTNTHCMTRHDTLYGAPVHRTIYAAIRYTLPCHLEIDIFLKCNSLDDSQQCMFMWNSIHEVLLVCNKWIKVRVSKCDIKLFEGFVVDVVAVWSRKWMTKVIEKVGREQGRRTQKNDRHSDVCMHTPCHLSNFFRSIASWCMHIVYVCHSWKVIFHRLTK